MKAFPECVSCMIRQAIEILARVEKNPKKRQQILARVLKKIATVDLAKVNPPELTKVAHKIIHKMTGIDDLYEQLKKQNNKEALSLYPYAKNLVKKAKEPLLMAIRIAIAGNIIDYGALADFNIKKTIQEVLNKKFAVLDYKKFKKDVKKSKLLLYIGDNAGEIAFDRILVEELVEFTKVVFVVKSKPVLNDVLMADAKMVGLDKVVKVIKSGSDYAGTNPKSATKAFKTLYNMANMVIAKGQGNFETLDQEKKNIYFMLKMKCPCLAQSCHLSKGDIILQSSKS